MILAWALACADPISNAFVTDDLAFLGAFPDPSLLSSPVTVQEGATAPALAGAGPAAEAFAAHTAYWRAVDQAIRTPGTLDTREDDARAWSGLQVAFVDGGALTSHTVDVRIERLYGAGGEVGYTWTVDQTDVDPRQIAGGRSGGTLHEARWGLGDGTALDLGASPRFGDQLFSFERVGPNERLFGVWFTDGDRYFGYAAALPILAGGGEATAAVVLENDAEGGMSGGLVFNDGGDCGAWRSCWTPDGVERFREGDGPVEAIGDVSACPATHPPFPMDLLRASCE